MSTLRRFALTVVALIAVLTLAACGSGDDAGPFELSTSPEFVNMVIPGRRPLALVTATGEGSAPIVLAGVASVDGATVEFEPTAVVPGGVAEVWVDVPDVGAETPVEVAITGTRDGDEHSVTVTATMMPGIDDLEPTALEIAAVFLDELSGTTEALPADTSDLVGGTPVAGLLVVSHYAWFTDDAEIGLAWHVMVAPDDWAELTVRPRTELAPTLAFRLTSWSTALAGGDVEIEAIEPPPDVTR